MLLLRYLSWSRLRKFTNGCEPDRNLCIYRLTLTGYKSSEELLIGSFQPLKRLLTPLELAESHLLLLTNLRKYKDLEIIRHDELNVRIYHASTPKLSPSLPESIQRRTM
jgi:hypothetical protein